MENVNPADLYRQGPPSFGHGLLKYFPLDPEYLNLNHGSFGSAPYVVHKTISDLNFKLEANPDKFLRLDYLSYLNDVRDRLAKLVGAQRDEIVLVPNASVGINTILRNLEWEKEDTIICFNTSYNSVHKTAYNLGDIPPYPTVSEIALKFPTTPQQIVDQFRAHLKSLPKPEGKKRIAIIDSIISNPGALLPWQELVKICKEEGVISVIDAAHSIGQEQKINLTAAAPDFWVSNCHKWLHAKRSVAMLYIPERNRHLIKTSHPTSHAYKPLDSRTLEDFIAQWEWNGTIDWLPFLTVGAALDFRQWIGGEAKIFDHCHNLALEGGRLMAEIFGTRVMDPNGEFTLNMVNVELPFPGSVPYSVKTNKLFMTKMLNERGAYSAHFYHNGRWWTRCSAQVYNELEDFEKLAKIWVEVCQEVKQELGLDEKKD
ncbi:PLP-dependent transferase [Macrolepiota fuliginosa MF-IS2]|uniref:PLP-dependent transferase n=1 Tax=Macrolepiota fuliginosa MF-IS2 TaxID=1400762 RepID=A0A9P5XK71_9AGAR|nr:PLP-dependent transferase [Macrolepiota fuliginosa MF-IS2]